VYNFSNKPARARRIALNPHRTGDSGDSGSSAERQFSPPQTEIPEFAYLKAAMRWHLEHGKRVPRELCAGCRAPLGDAEATDLADGNRVHLDPDYRCLIRWGEIWRRVACNAVESRRNPHP
jgi:hypothetical protein